MEHKSPTFPELGLRNRWTEPGRQAMTLAIISILLYETVYRHPVELEPEELPHFPVPPKRVFHSNLPWWGDKVKIRWAITPAGLWRFHPADYRSTDWLVWHIAKKIPKEDQQKSLSLILFSYVITTVIMMFPFTINYELPCGGGRGGNRSS